MSNIFWELGSLIPNVLLSQKRQGKTHLRSVCFTFFFFFFFTQTITHRVFPGCLYLDKAVQHPVKGK